MLADHKLKPDVWSIPRGLSDHGSPYRGQLRLPQQQRNNAVLGLGTGRLS